MIKIGDKVRIDFNEWINRDSEVIERYEHDFSTYGEIIDTESRQIIKYLMDNTLFTVSMIDTINDSKIEMIELKELADIGIKDLFYKEDLEKVSIS